MPYWRLHYHLAWRTYARLPVLSEECLEVVRRSIYTRARRLGARVHAVNGTADHVHVVASVPPVVAVAECAGQLKGASSHTANEWLRTRSAFRWSGGYGALTVGERALPIVIAYVQNQAEHHRQGTVHRLLEKCEDEEGDAW